MIESDKNEPIGRYTWHFGLKFLNFKPLEFRLKLLHLSLHVHDWLLNFFRLQGTAFKAKSIFKLFIVLISNRVALYLEIDHEFRCEPIKALIFDLHGDLAIDADALDIVIHSWLTIQS